MYDFIRKTSHEVIAKIRLLLSTLQNISNIQSYNILTKQHSLNSDGFCCQTVELWKYKMNIKNNTSGLSQKLYALLKGIDIAKCFYNFPNNVPKPNYTDDGEFKDTE